MTLEELDQACTEAEKAGRELGIKNPGIRLMIEGIRTRETCRIVPGLSGKNLGHYEGKTIVFVRAKIARKFLKQFHGDRTSPLGGS